MNEIIVTDGSDVGEVGACDAAPSDVDAIPSGGGSDDAARAREADAWRERAEKAERRLYERDYDDALSRGLQGVKFSSEAARRDTVARIKAAGLELSCGELVGLGGLIEEMRREDAGAFAGEGAPHVKFTVEMNARHAGTVTASTAAKRKIMAIRDRSERRAAIAANMDLFEN